MSRREPGLTVHAVQRWRQRVSPGVAMPEAAEEILEMVACGKRAQKPRGWMRRAGHRESIHQSYIYWHERPGVVLVVRDGVVVTVITRSGSRWYRQVRREFDRDGRSDRGAHDAARRRGMGEVR